MIHKEESKKKKIRCLDQTNTDKERYPIKCSKTKEKNSYQGFPSFNQLKVTQCNYSFGYPDKPLFRKYIKCYETNCKSVRIEILFLYMYIYK